MSYRSWVMAAAAALAGSGEPAFADGGCDAVRPLTAQERAFHAQRDTLLDFFPEAHEGWEVSSSPDPVVEDQMSTCKEAGPPPRMYASIRTHYARSISDEEMMQVAQAIAPSNDPKRQAKLDQLIARQEELAKKIAAAAERQDFAAIERLAQESETLAAEMEAFQQPSQEIFDQVLVKDSSAAVTVSFNAEEVFCYDRREALQIAKSLAFLCQADGDPGGQGDRRFNAMLYVALGPWRAELAEDGLRLVPGFVESAPHTAVQNVLVEIDADAARAKRLLKSLDLERLRRQIR